MTACLAWGVGAVISHRAAAAFWRLVGFDRGPAELTVPGGRRRAGPGIIHHYRLSRADVTTVDGIPITTPARTLLDLAAVASIDAVEEALDDALRRGIVSIASLRRRLAAETRRGRRGIAGMRTLLDARDPSVAIPESVFERRLLRVLRRTGLHPPVLQYEVRAGDRLVAIVDFAYPAARLAIEADGFRYHSGRNAWDRDRARRNQLTLLGWRVIHVTWTDLQRPARLIAAIRQALGTRS
jgi:very-short-patch-repair endonuclease